MIHVECPSCSAPYDLDERRLPASGLKMRCPKCGASFHVATDGTVGEAAAAAPPKAPLKRKRPKATMVGLGGGAPAVPAPPKPAAPSLDLDLPAPRAKPAAFDGTDLPAPAGAKRAKKPIAPAFDGTDLPAPSTRKAPPRRAVPAPKKAPIAPDFDADLPAPRGARPAPKKPIAPDFDADLPAPRAAKRKPLAPDFPASDLDLPAARAAKAPDSLDLPSTDSDGGFDLDLPAPRGAKPGRSAQAPDELDLPAPRGAKPGPGLDLDLPAPRGAKPSPGLDLDLPAPRGAKLSPGLDLDLPAPRGAKPSPDLDLDLPAPRGAQPSPDLDLDLPAPRGTKPRPDLDLDLPAPRSAKPSPSLDLDLPAPKGAPAALDLDLPAPRSKGSNDLELDLPAPKSSGMELDLDLPAPRAAGGAAELDLDLPAPRGAASSLELDLPGNVGGLELDLDLPAPGRGGLDLPAVSTAGVDLPGPAAAVTDLPAPGGGLDLPAPSQGGVDLPKPAPTPFDDFDADLPSPRAEFDLPQVAQNTDLPGTPFDSDLPDLDDELELPPPRARGGNTPDGRAGAGGAGFGELDLGGGGGDENLEFDAIPEKEDEPDFDSGLDLPPSDAPPKRAAARSEQPDAPDKKKKKTKGRGLLAFAGFLLLVVGAGVGLKWTPYGLFGMYFVEQFRSEAGDASRVAAVLSEADELASADTYGGTRAALRVLADARGEMFLNRELLARSVVYEAMFQTRFGDDSRSEGRESRILERLATRSNEAPGMALALAAHELREGNYAQAGTHRLDAASENANDTLLHLVTGEHALAVAAPEEARAAFEAAADAGGARAAWGLARTAMLSGDDEAIDAAIEATLALSPSHAGALVAKARRAIAAGRSDEGLALARTAAETTEPAQRASPLQRAEAFTLVGEQLEALGRRGDARRAYTTAVELQPFGVGALLGLGRLGISERRFRDALTQFQAAEQAAGSEPAASAGALTPADLARLGQARAMMALDAPQEARAIAAALAQAYPESAEVALRHGQVLATQDLKSEAIAELERAIGLDTANFEPYLGLASLYFDSDEPEQAISTIARAREAVEMTSDVHRMLGESALSRDLLAEAGTEFRAALTGNAEDPAALFGLGVTLRRQNRWVQAGQRFETLSALDPAYPGLSLERGRIFEALGQAERAVSSYSAASEDDPENLDLLVRLGGAQVAANHLDDAETTLERVMADRADSAEVMYFMGRISLARGQTADALNHFSRAVAIDGGVAQYRLYNARGLLESNQLGRAAEEVARALELDPALGPAYLLRGQVRVRTGAVRDAVEDLRRALELQPALPEANAALAEAFAQLNNGRGAIAEYERAVAGDATHGKWWYRLARIRMDEGLRAEALPAADRAIALAVDVEADSPPLWTYDAFRIRGEALWSSNRADATRAYEQYLERAPQSALDRSEVEGRLGR